MNAFTTRLSIAAATAALAVASLTAPAGALGSSELSSTPRATHKVAKNLPAVGESGSLRTFCQGGTAVLAIDGKAADPSEAAGTTVQIAVAKTVIGDDDSLVTPLTVFTGQPGPDGRLRAAIRVQEGVDLLVRTRVTTVTGGDGYQASSLSEERATVRTPVCD